MIIGSDIWPLTIILDRYSGTYSKGKWLAFNLDAYNIPKQAIGDDVESVAFWSNHGNNLIVGKGNTIEEALKDLESKKEYHNIFGRLYIDIEKGTQEQSKLEENLKKYWFG